MMKAHEEAVQRGALYLDEKRPGWAADINIEFLSMSDCQTCILGQLWGHYEDAGHILLPPNEALDDTQLAEQRRQFMLDHGFTSLTGVTFSVLQRYWVIEVSNRLEA